MNTIQETNKKLIFKASIVTIAVNLALSVIKFIAGILGNSGAMVADAVHSASDVLSTLVVMVGVKISIRGEDKEHPYGHDRIECVAAVILAMVLAVTGVFIGWNGIEVIIGRKIVSGGIPGLLPLVVAVISILAKEGMYWYTRAVAIKANSDALRADAWHHRSDALSSVGALAGIAGARMGFPILDPVASVIIAIIVVKVAFDIARDAMNKMLDAAMDEGTEEELRSKILSYSDVYGIDDLRTRRFGSSFYLDLEISMDGNMSLHESHAIAEQIHDDLEDEYPHLKHCMIHVNPVEFPDT